MPLWIWLANLLTERGYVSLVLSNQWGLAASRKRRHVSKQRFLQGESRLWNKFHRLLAIDLRNAKFTDGVDFYSLQAPPGRTPLGRPASPISFGTAKKRHPPDGEQEVD